MIVVNYRSVIPGLPKRKRYVALSSHDSKMNSNQNIEASFGPPVMPEKDMLAVLFRVSNVERASLLAECIYSIDRYLTLEEGEIKEISWVDKKGNREQMIKDAEIASLLNFRDVNLRGVDESQQTDKTKELAASFAHIPVVRDILKNFVSTAKAKTIAQGINRIEDITIGADTFSNLLQVLNNNQREKVNTFFSQRRSWSYEALEKLNFKVNVLTEALWMRAVIANSHHSILEPAGKKKFRDFLLNNWFSIIESESFMDLSVSQNLIMNSCDEEMFVMASKLFSLGDKKLYLLTLFLNEIIKMKESIPGIARKAISTVNPFMFRSLFLSYEDAQEFAVGGKLNSSLETKYGSLFESLMTAFNYCRGIYDGGVDVAVGQNAFDIKSGPKVMNKSMVDAFSAKQQIIERENLLPDLRTYKIALGYGIKDNLNSFMASIETEVLPAREAWYAITGVEHSPELVFGIAALVPKIFAVKSLVGTMLGSSELHCESDEDRENFESIFSGSFSPIQLSDEATDELNHINSLI